MKDGMKTAMGALLAAGVLAAATACRPEQGAPEHAAVPERAPAASAEAADLEREIAATAVELQAVAKRLEAVPGPPLSDYALDLVLAPDHPPPVDADTSALLLASHRTVTADLRTYALGRLRAEAAANAYYALALMEYGHFRAKDPALVREALDAGATAPVYRSPFVGLVDQLAARTPSDLGDPDRPAAERALGVADFFATSAAGQVVGLYAVCHDAAADIRGKCARVATTVHDGAATFIEALEAATLLDHLDPASAGRREAALRDLRTRALALVRDPQVFTDAVSARYFATWRREGDLAAWRELLAAAGPAVAGPPAGPDASDSPAAPDAKPGG